MTTDVLDMQSSFIKQASKQASSAIEDTLAPVLWGPIVSVSVTIIDIASMHKA